jgi:DNA-binding NarL/FixJ family response regulator
MTDPVRPPLRVFLADDHPLVLDGIKALILADARLALVGEAEDGLSAAQRAIDLQPDVAVLDLSMPGLNGIEVARRLLAVRPHCRVVILTMHEDAAYLRQVLEIGVAGYVLKRSAADELGRAIHIVAAGGTYLDPAIAARAAGRGANRRNGGPEAGPATDLSPREIEVLRLTAIGHSNKSISNTLRIGVKSVDTYKARAMEKLGFRNKVEVVRLALSRGWFGEP